MEDAIACAIFERASTLRGRFFRTILKIFADQLLK